MSFEKKSCFDALAVPFRLNTLQVSNRLVRSAIHENMVDETGIPTRAYHLLYQKASRSGVGLIITGHMFVNWNGCTFSGMTGIDSDECVPVLKQVTDGVHQSEAKIFAQLNHGGFRVLPEKGKQVRAPSRLGHVQALTSDEIEQIIVDFGRAAERAKKAGFDGVQIHGAHSYLIAQFLSRNRNKRRDCYGGSLRNRQRFFLEVYQEIRRRVGVHFPVIVKLDSYSSSFVHLFSPHAFITIEESLNTGRLLVDEGIDAVEVSCGFYAARGAIPLKSGVISIYGALGKSCLGRVFGMVLTPLDVLLNQNVWFRAHHNIDHIRCFKQNLSVPILAGSSFDDPSYMNMVVERGWADMICLARPLIFDPLFARKILQGSTQSSGCIRCNLCIALIPNNRSLRCYYGVPRYEKRKKENVFI